MRARTRKHAVAAAAAIVALALPGAAAAAQAPAVLSARALPGALSARGGTVEAIGKVRGATNCHLAVLGDHGIKVTLPKSANCTGGAYREPVKLGPNHTKSAIVVKLGLFAGPARGVFYVVVTPAPAPSHPGILEARAYPWELTYKGGWATIIGHTVHAKTCHLVALGWKHPDLAAQDCASGNFIQKLWLSPNTKHAAEPQHFELVAAGNGTAVGKFFVRLGPAPLPAPTTTTTLPPPPQPTTTTTTPPSVPIVPYIPPTAPQTSPTTVPQTTTTTVPQTTTTTQPALTSTSTTQSYNWSGYVIAPPSDDTFSNVTGTFVIPTVSPPGGTSSSDCNDSVGNWVGVDGFAASDGYLLQAGVDSTPCDGGQVDYPWYEVITPTSVAPSTYITNWNSGPLTGTSATVNPGDKITVTIAETATSGTWDVTLNDTTTGGAWTSDINWAGPGQSAEWVTEDPDQPDNSNCTYQPAATTLYLCPLPDFGTVDFSNLGVSPGGSTGSWTGIDLNTPMGQSTPSQLQLDGTFDTTYAPPSGSITVQAPFVRTLGTPMPGR